jgi:hypothetical protein
MVTAIAEEFTKIERRRAQLLTDPSGVVQKLKSSRLDHARPNMLVVDKIWYAVLVHRLASAAVAKKFKRIDESSSDGGGQIR